MTTITPQNDTNPTLEASTMTIEEALEAVKARFYALYRDLKTYEPSAFATFESATKEEQAVILDKDLGFMLVAFAVAKDFDIDYRGFTHLMQSLEQKMMIGTFHGKACESKTYALLVILSIRLATKSVSRVLAQAHPVKAITAFFGG